MIGSIGASAGACRPISGDEGDVPHLLADNRQLSSATAGVFAPGPAGYDPP